MYMEAYLRAYSGIARFVDTWAEYQLVLKKYINDTKNPNEAKHSGELEVDAYCEKGKKKLPLGHSGNSRMTTSGSPPCTNPRNRPLPLHVLDTSDDLQ